ncbi:protein hedgehog [Eupeodes corollae]|uniref:protein hedgehog n=1 Tax=Eupeodes corollae TaxID=290404 RepID=UPI00248FC036|nr:protein hedgehog [Eupeodes corollae]
MKQMSKISQKISTLLLPSSKHILAILILVTIFTTSVHACGPGRGIGGPRKNRKLTPLVFKQHVPNMSENTLGASGLNEGRINRDDAKFKDLVPNYNRDIIFKDEEGTGADRVMTQRCKDKLNTLAVSVMNQWPGIRLRVTESWDEDNNHRNDSLHYEGRAVDITTSDRDRTKYGMLARLAVEAGFDWVYYESRAHIHCSVKSDSTQTNHMSGCFTGESTVLTSSGEKKQMSELQVGDQVLSMTADGSTVYSEIILFLDRDIERTQEFVRIQTDGGAVLKVTAQHLVMVWNPAKKLMKFVFADQVEESDFVLVNRFGNLEPQKVVNLSAIKAKGVVAPLTREGTIIVDSVAASCYAVIDSQRMAHWSFWPYRMLATMHHWVGETNSIQDGVHWYARALFSIKDSVLPSSWMHH